MSLTSLIKTNKELVNKIDKSINFKPFRIKKPLLIFSNDNKDDKRKYKFTTIGTAYDYIVRINLLKHKGETFNYRNTISYQGYNNYNNKPFGTINIVVYTYILNKVETYTGGELTFEQAKAFLQYAIFDSYGRKQFKLTPFELSFTDEEVNDLIALSKLGIDTLLELNPVNIDVNPTFLYSKLYGGADADLIIDDILIDIKTTIVDQFTKDYIHQLIGYYTLCKLENKNINKIGIYFARHNHLELIDIDKLIKIDEFDELLSFIGNGMKNKIVKPVNNIEYKKLSIFDRIIKFFRGY